MRDHGVVNGAFSKQKSLLSLLRGWGGAHSKSNDCKIHPAHIRGHSCIVSMGCLYLSWRTKSFPLVCHGFLLQHLGFYILILGLLLFFTQLSSVNHRLLGFSLLCQTIMRIVSRISRNRAKRGGSVGKAFTL